MDKSTRTNEEFFKQLDVARWMVENANMKLFGDSVLVTQCEPVLPEEFGTDELKETCNRITDALAKVREHAQLGVGLAANQIGILKRIIVVYLDGKLVACINPEVVSAKGLGAYAECCLSSGLLVVGEVVRPLSAEFRYWDFDGNEHTLKANHAQTRMMLHEIDHLNGEICLHKYEGTTSKLVLGGRDEIIGYRMRELPTA